MPRKAASLSTPANATTRSGMPDANAPSAAHNAPVSAYLANKSVLDAESDAAASFACSKGRKTLTSPELGLSVPTKATSNSGRSKTQPGSCHQQCSGQHECLSSPAMAPCTDGQSSACRTKERRRGDRTDLNPAKSHRQQINGQQHSHEAVGKATQRARGKYRGYADIGPVRNQLLEQINWSSMSTDLSSHQRHLPQIPCP
jgi:hypothetical protein